jgi:ABC-2 type transport system ATP-binding protein
MQPAVLLENVTKRFQDHTAVADLSLVVPAGTIYGILGPNGAGKTTTLRMIMSILLRDGGRIGLLGRDPESDRRVLRRVGYLPEERGLYRRMRALDVIVFFAELKGVGHAAARREGMAWLERMGLADQAGQRIDGLSKGMQQKVQFIATVLHEPDVLILDEPHSGLDPVNQQVLRDTIFAARDQGRTVLLSTHNMTEAEQLCDAVCIIADGRKVLDGRTREIRRSHRGHRFHLEFDTHTDGIERFLRHSRLFTAVAARNGGWDVEVEPGLDTRALIAELNALESPLSRFEHLEPSLHDIFVAQVRAAQVAARRPETRHA